MQWIKLLILLSVVTLWAWNSEAQTSGGGPYTHSPTLSLTYNGGSTCYPYQIAATTSTSSVYSCIGGVATLPIGSGGGGGNINWNNFPGPSSATTVNWSNISPLIVGDLVTQGPYIDIRSFSGGTPSTSFATISDNTSAITTAFALSQSTGKCVKMPHGFYEYNSASSLDLTSVCVDGDGWGLNVSGVSGTYVYFYGLGSTAAMTTTNTSSVNKPARITNMAFLSSSWSGTTGAAGFGLEAENEVLLDNVMFYGFGTSGIVLHHDLSSIGPYNSALVNVTSIYNGHHGIVIGTGANVVQITNPQCKWNGAPSYGVAPSVAGSYDGLIVTYSGDGNPGSLYPAFVPLSVSIDGGYNSYNSEYGWNLVHVWQSSHLFIGYSEGNLGAYQASMGNDIYYDSIHFSSMVPTSSGTALVNWGANYGPYENTNHCWFGGQDMGDCSIIDSSEFVL